jgi:hypothetical protein
MEILNRTEKKNQIDLKHGLKKEIIISIFWNHAK